MTAKKPKTRDDVVLVEIDDEALVYDPEREGVDYLNASAKLVFQLCDGTATPAQTASQIAEAVGAPIETVQHDVQVAVRRLGDLGLLERPNEASGAPAASADGESAERTSPIRLDVRPGPCTEKVDRLAWPVEQSYELGPYQLGVRTNSERFGSWLEDTLSQYRRSERIGPLYSVLIPEGSRQREKFNVLYRESLVLARTLDVAELVRTLRFELESFLFAEWDEAILTEAAVVSTGGGRALVPSLIASELSRDRKRAERAGISAPPGGRMAIDPDVGRLVPIQPQLAVLDDALGGLVGVEHASQVRSSSADDGLPAFDVVCLPSPLTEARFESISRAAAVHLLVDLVPNLPRLGARALEGLARLTEGVPCYRITSKPDQMLDALAAAITSQSADAKVAQ